MERRDFIAAIAAALTAPASEVFAQARAPSLKDACKNLFVIGTALDFRSPNEFNATELDLIKSQFNAITPENSMKPGRVGVEVRQKVDSPTPKTDTSWNCPGM